MLNSFYNGRILDFHKNIRFSKTLREYQEEPYPIEKTAVVFLDPPKKMRVTFVGFNITGILFLNIPQNLIRNFIQIYGEYIMGMLHEYSTNISFPVKYLLNENINDCK